MVELAILGIAIFLCAVAAVPYGAPLLLALCFGLFRLKELDRYILVSSPLYFASDVIVAALSASVLSSVAFRIFPRLTPTPESWLASLLLAACLPIVLKLVLVQLARNKRLVERVLIVGDGEMARTLYRAILACGRNPSRKAPPSSIEDGAVSVDVAAIHGILERERISRVVVAEQDVFKRKMLSEALLDSRLRGLHVSDAVDFYERLSGKVWVEAIDSEWFIWSEGFDQLPGGRLVKRIADVVLSLILIVLTAPLLAICAIAVKLTSAGPVLFRQVRVGLYGEAFVLFKFRSMRQDAESETGPTWAREKDHRVTRIGRFLRRFRLDELPQAFNVLRGEMSLVGPRPERPYFADLLAKEIPFYRLRHYVKPGITGWAQVMYHYGASIDDARHKLHYDLYYTKHRSTWRDLEILLKTVKIVLFSNGS